MFIRNEDVLISYTKRFTSFQFFSLKLFPLELTTKSLKPFFKIPDIPFLRLQLTKLSNFVLNVIFDDFINSINLMSKVKNKSFLYAGWEIGKIEYCFL